MILTVDLRATGLIAYTLDVAGRPGVYVMPIVQHVNDLPMFTL